MFFGQDFKINDDKNRYPDSPIILRVRFISVLMIAANCGLFLIPLTAKFQKIEATFSLRMKYWCWNAVKIKNCTCRSALDTAGLIESAWLSLHIKEIFHLCNSVQPLILVITDGQFCTNDTKIIGIHRSVEKNGKLNQCTKIRLGWAPAHIREELPQNLLQRPGTNKIHMFKFEQIISREEYDSSCEI